MLCIMHASWLSRPINGNESFLGLSAASLPLLVVAACFVIFYCSFSNIFNTYMGKKKKKAVF